MMLTRLQGAKTSEGGGDRDRVSEEERERKRERVQDVDSTVQGLTDYAFFFPKLFIEDRFIIPICQASKDFN